MGNLGAKLRRVLNAVRTDAGMLEHDLVDGIRAAGQRKQAAAATDKCIKVLELQARLPQCSKNQIAAIRHLSRNPIELGEVLRIVRNVLAELALITLKNAHLRGSGARVDYQDAPGSLFIGHTLSLLKRLGAHAAHHHVADDLGAEREQSHTIFLKP